MKLSLFVFIATLCSGMLFISTASAVDCNSLTQFCATEHTYADPSVESCVEKEASSSCTQRCVYTYYGGCTGTATHYDSACVQFGWAGGTQVGYSCNGPTKILAEIDTNATSCSGSGFCGWRDGVNKTGSSAVGNAARAKLHVCNSTGKSAESNWYTDNAACRDAEPSYNDYCTTSVWEDLCDGYLPPVKK